MGAVEVLGHHENRGKEVKNVCCLYATKPVATVADQMPRSAIDQRTKFIGFICSFVV